MPNEALLQQEFPQDESLIYLNHAAVAPWPARTARAVQAFAEENVRSGARDYHKWLEQERQLREQCRQFINAASTGDVAFLKNTSEGLSVIAEGLPWNEGDNVVTSDEEFPSNRVPWVAQERHGVGLREISLQVDDPEAALMEACDAHTRVLTISSVQYASGLRLDLPRLGAFCRERDIVFCVDAIQSLGAIALDVQAACIDCLAADAHKWLLGPEGIAVFYCRPGLREQLALHQFGWHMLRDAGDFDSPDTSPAESALRFECGSPNMLGIHAFAASLSLLQEVGMERIEAGVVANNAYLMDGLQGITGVEVLSRQDPGRYAGIMVFRVPGRNNDELHARLLDNQVVCAARGGGIRLSPHFYTPRHKLDKAIEVISTIT
jgi:cysteine desulfurase/selenocysteine lyase